MTKRDHLTAVPTVDKNGKHTTVYRKNEKEPKVVQSFPSPVATPSAVHRLELDRKVSLALLDVGWHEARDRRLVVDTVKGLSVGTVLRIDQMLASAGDDRDKLTKQITEEVKHGADDPDFESRLNHSLHFYPVISDWPYSLVRKIIGSLNHYEQLPPMENFTYDDDVMEKCVALLRVFDAAHLTIPEGTPWYNNLYCMFEDERLVELIFDNPEKSELLAATVRDRRTIDAEMLSLVVHGEASALSSGTL